MGDEVDVTTAERAALLELGEDDAVFLDGDLEQVAFADAERTADLGGQHDSPEVVDLAGHTGGSGTHSES